MKKFWIGILGIILVLAMTAIPVENSVTLKNQQGSYLTDAEQAHLSFEKAQKKLKKMMGMTTHIKAIGYFLEAAYYQNQIIIEQNKEIIWQNKKIVKLLELKGKIR